MFRAEDQQFIYNVPAGRPMMDAKYPIPVLGDLKVFPAKDYYRHPPFTPVHRRNRRFGDATFRQPDRTSPCGLRGRRQNSLASMDNIAFQGLIGLSLAMYLWLISAGLTIIFGVLRIVNFAHGSLFMVGAYLAYTFYGQMGLPFGAGHPPEPRSARGCSAS